MFPGKELETDIVVVGGGGAGICAAVAAAEKNTSVIVLEKRSFIGGNSIFPAGPFAINSPVQERLRIKTSPEEWFRRHMDFTRWKANPKIVRAWIYRTGDTIRWLEEKGIRFIGLRGKSYGVPVFHMLDGIGARHMFEVLIKECERLGIKVICNTHAKKILTDGKGKVAGVLAVTRSGEELTITSKAVIIATGGYGGNKELLSKYYPAYHENIVCMGYPHSGDGLLMAMEIGAATEGLGMLQLCGPVAKNVSKHTRNGKDKYGFPVDEAEYPVDEDRYIVTTFARARGHILVNKRGERFVDESITEFPVIGNAVDRQPEKIVFSIIDEKIKQEMIQQWKPDWKWEIPSVEETLKALNKYEEAGYIKVANSLEELAEWMGVDPTTLRTTIEEYNSFCEKGHDDLFLKSREHLIPLRDPPYYGFKLFSGFYTTIGGIKVNERMEVLDKQDNPIPGLFAAGVDVGGWQAETYNVSLPGSSFSFAINSGRIAGENAAEYVLKTTKRC